MEPRFEGIEIIDKDGTSEDPEVQEIELQTFVALEEAFEEFMAENCPPDDSTDPREPDIKPQYPQDVRTPVINPRIPAGGWYTEDCDECCAPITDKIINYLELKVVTFTSPDYAARLSAGVYSPDLIVEEARSAGHALVKTISPRDHIAKSMSKAEVKVKRDGSRVYNFIYEASFSIKADKLSHLEVASYLTLDHKRMADDFGVESFGRSQVEEISSLMNFRVNSEKIITNGQPVTTSIVLKEKETGAVWDGPVHYHESRGFMGGDIHTPSTHPTLEQEKVPNVKIKDHRIKREMLNLDLEALTRPPRNTVSEDRGKASISEPIPSKSSDGKTRFLFFIDQANMLRTSCLFPGFREDSIYDAGVIEGIQIHRARGTTTKDRNRLGIAKASGDNIENQSQEKELVVSSQDRVTRGFNAAGSKGALASKTRVTGREIQGSVDKEVGEIEEISVSGLPKYRVFSVADSEISERRQGKYQYSVSMQFKDPTVFYLNDKIDSMCMAKDDLEDVLKICQQGKNYNTLSKKFSNRYMKTFGKKHTEAVYGALVEMADFLSAVSSGAEPKVINYILSQASVQTGSPQGIQDIIEIMGSFEMKIRSLLGRNLKIERFHDAKSVERTKIFSKNNSGKGTLEFEKDFDFVVDRGEGDDFGYDYAGPAIRSFPRMTASQYVMRQNEEVRKYFSQKGNTSSGDRMSSLSPAKKAALASLRGTYQYLTPAHVRVGHTSIGMIGASSEMNNIDKQTRIVSSILQKNNSDSTTYTNMDEMSSIAKDIFSSAGVTVYSGQDTSSRTRRPQKEQEYASSARKVFGDKSFNSRNIDKTITHSQKNNEDHFVEASSLKILAALNDNMAQNGALTNDAPSKADQQVRERNKSESFLTELSIKQFDSEREDSILSTMSVDKIKALPPSMRSLFLARSKGSRNWLDFEKDLLQDPELKNIFRLNHSNVVKVEYLASVRQPRLGKSLRRLAYRPLTRAALNRIAPRTPLLVRLTPITIPKLGIGMDSGTDMSIYGRNFLIYADGNNDAATTPTRPPNIASRKTRTTNYIKRQMARLVLNDPTEIRTVLNKNY